MSLADQLVDAFVEKWNEKLINNGGIQCPAVFNQYENEVIHGGWIGTPVTGYADDIWTQFGTDTDYDNFIRVTATEPAQKGDVAIWFHYNGGTHLPHIALVISDNGSTITCLTQNPGNANIAVLTKNGLAGYLRPKKFIVEVSTPAPVPMPTPQPAVVPPEPVQPTFAVGDVVIPTALVDYTGTHLTQWDQSYTITEITGDRAVLSARDAVWAAMSTANIKKV